MVKIEKKDKSPNDKIDHDFNLKELLIEITDKCPLNCLHCSSNSNIKNNKFISKEIIFDILHQGKKLKAKEFQISGGEPFLHTDLLYISLKAVKMGYNISIYTSGNNYVKNKIIEISKDIFNKIEQKSNHKIIFGIHGIDKKTHEFITQKKGSYVNLLNSIRNSINAGIKTELHFVPNKININQIGQLLKFAEDIGIFKVSILRFVKHGRGDLNCNIYEINENIELFDLFSVLKKSYGDFLRLGSPYNPFGIEPLKRCSAGFDKLTITPNLEIYPCVAFKNIVSPVKFGKFNLIDAFKSDLFKMIRNFSIEDINDCNFCNNKNICNGGCIAQRLIQNKYWPYTKDNVCPVINNLDYKLIEKNNVIGVYNGNRY